MSDNALVVYLFGEAQANSGAEMHGVKEEWERRGQGHVFEHWDELTEEERAALVADCERVNLDDVERRYRMVLEQNENGAQCERLAPLEDQDELSGAERDAARARGLQHIACGKLAVVLMCGGQGSRLGSANPKGMFVIGHPNRNVLDNALPSLLTTYVPSDLELMCGMSLFQLHFERLRTLQGLAKDDGTARIHIWLMTSPATDSKTKEYLQEHHYFNLDPDQVHFCTQDTFPATDENGLVVLQTRSSLFRAPNGNGGIYEALKSGGAIESFEENGVETIYVFAVDNVLARIADPVFVGYFIEKGADCGAKVVEKVNPTERVGLLCSKGGKPAVVEYSLTEVLRSEISSEDAHARDESGRLQFNAANICIHMYSVEFVKRVSQKEVLDALPLHVAKRQVESVASDGAVCKRLAWKYEMFIFDVFCHSNRMVALEVHREEEFAPLKNKEGSDSPETCKSLLWALHRRFIEDAGGVVQGTDERCEISPKVSYAGEGIANLVSGKVLTTPLLLT